MNPLLAVLVAALMFVLFGLLHRRDGERSCGADPEGCGKADPETGCSACHPIHERTESSHGRF